METYQTDELTKEQLEMFRKRYDVEIGCDFFEETDTYDGKYSVMCNFEGRKELALLRKIENEVLK